MLKVTDTGTPYKEKKNALLASCKPKPARLIGRRVAKETSADIKAITKIFM